MSLRRDLHAAFDELEPSVIGLPERVVDSVMADGRSRRRREGMVFRLRAPLSLVAVMLLIALVVGALIGGRLVQDWNASHSTPAGQLTNAQQIADLEARPWQQAMLKTGAACPDGPHDTNGDYGIGPFHGITGGTSTDTGWGTYWHLIAGTEPGTRGLLLLRARDLVTGVPMVFVGPYVTGAVVGTDVLNGTVQQHSELLLDMSRPPNSTIGPGASNLTYWQFTVGFPRGTTCVGWQIDGRDFTETFAFRD